MTLSCQDLNAQLDQAEVDTAAAHERRRETEEQLVGIQEEMARVKSTLNGQVVELDKKLSRETQTSKQLQRDKVCVFGGGGGGGACRGVWVCFHVFSSHSQTSLEETLARTMKQLEEFSASR